MMRREGGSRERGAKARARAERTRRPGLGEACGVRETVGRGRVKERVKERRARREPRGSESEQGEGV